MAILPPAILLGFPAAAWFALAAVPVAAAFFYRRRGRSIEIPSVFLWEQIGRPVDVQSIATLLRRLLSLAVQFLLLPMLVFPLAHPLPRPQATGPPGLAPGRSAPQPTPPRPPPPLPPAP